MSFQDGSRERRIFVFISLPGFPFQFPHGSKTRTGAIYVQDGSSLPVNPFWKKKALLETSTAPTFQVILEPVKLTAQILAAHPETPGIMSSSYPEAFLQCPD